MAQRVVVRVSCGEFEGERADEVRSKLDEGARMKQPSVSFAPLAAMLAQRATFEKLGVRFEPVRNYPTLWTITP